MSDISNPTLSELLHAGATHEFTLSEMESWGEAVGRLLPPRCVVTLGGDLGTGKTTLARALCRGLGVLDLAAVTSPTFAIMQEYATSTGAVTHVDLYRLERDIDLDTIGWDEVVYSAGALIVEWPERNLRPWPAGRIHMGLAHVEGSDQTRTLSVTPT